MTILNENKLTLTKLAQRERVNTSTAWRWAQRGVKGIKLETFKIGGRRYTTNEAFIRFVEGTTAAANGEQPAQQARTNRQRELAVDRAEAELAHDGI